MPWKRSSGFKSYSRCYRSEATEEQKPITETSESVRGHEERSDAVQVSVPCDSVAKDSSEALALSA